MPRRRFAQVDVFSEDPFGGNPVAVVLDGDGVSDVAMQRFATWTNLSETTFVLPPTDDAADYRVRIFTPVAELPFAGHPTLGTCHAWLGNGGVPRRSDGITQQCAAGLVPLQRREGRLAFAAPPMRRSGAVDAGFVEQVADAYGIDPAAIVAAEWVDNGPGWVGLLLRSAADVLEVRPRFIDADVGLAGLHPAGSAAALEVRAFFPKDGNLVEDPVTGSLNASLAQWLTASGRLAAPYIAAQGTVLGRTGRVHISADADGTIWVGGATVTSIAGEVDL